jgi:hypothetical protein
MRSPISSTATGSPAHGATSPAGHRRCGCRPPFSAAAISSRSQPRCWQCCATSFTAVPIDTGGAISESPQRRHTVISRRITGHHTLRSGERRISHAARPSPSGRGASLIKIIGADLDCQRTLSERLEIHDHGGGFSPWPGHDSSSILNTSGESGSFRRPGSPPACAGLGLSTRPDRATRVACRSRRPGSIDWDNTVRRCMSNPLASWGGEPDGDLPELLSL